MLDASVCGQCAGSGEIQVSSGPESFEMHFITCPGCWGRGMASATSDTGLCPPHGLQTKSAEAMEAAVAAMGPQQPHDCDVDDGTRCEDCCDHDDADEYSCLDCGKEMMEDRMAAAFDRAKASRQDG